VQEVSKVKISLPDRTEALRRYPEYCKDWEKREQANREASDKEFETITAELKAKYHVPELPMPLEYSRYDRLKNKPRAIEAISFVDPKERGSGFWEIESTPGLPFFSKGHTLTIDDFLEERRYLHLKVDLEESLPTLKKFFVDLVEEWKKYGNLTDEKDKRQGTTSVDHWDVYDLHVFGRKSLLRIAKDRRGRNNNPGADEYVEGEYKQVQRAFKKAKNIMENLKK
jgi:hypothetical protein